jgi:ketose-bisphosphate aldolase
MPLVPFRELLADAERRQYAIGYFESWNLESLQAVADASESTGSPVLLGFSGIYLHHPRRRIKERLSLYAALGNEIGRRLKTPACLVYNESPHFEHVLEAIQLGFGLVMFSDENLSFDQQSAKVGEIVPSAHRAGVAVEGELMSLPGVGGELSSVPDDVKLTVPRQARTFVEQTGIDALAVNIGQAHLHGRKEVRLDLARLAELRETIRVPLVLHGASSISRADLENAIRLGIRKINVGSVLKRSYLEALRRTLQQLGSDFNPYEVIGSGLDNDVLAQGRLALQKVVEDLMCLFGSVGRA